MARYQSDATTAKELIICAVALIASQLIDYERIEGEDRFNCTAESGSAERRPTSEFSAGALVGRDSVKPRWVYNACYEVPVEVYRPSPITLAAQQFLAQFSPGYGAMRFALVP